MVVPSVISTFAGGGGSSLGYHMAGYKELLAIDFEQNACDTLRLNFDFPVWQRDIQEVTAEETLSFCHLKSGVGGTMLEPVYKIFKSIKAFFQQHKAPSI